MESAVRESVKKFNVIPCGMMTVLTISRDLMSDPATLPLMMQRQSRTIGVRNQATSIAVFWDYSV